MVSACLRHLWGRLKRAIAHGIKPVHIVTRWEWRRAIADPRSSHNRGEAFASFESPQHSRSSNVDSDFAPAAVEASHSCFALDTAQSLTPPPKQVKLSTNVQARVQHDYKHCHQSSVSGECRKGIAAQAKPGGTNKRPKWEEWRHADGAIRTRRSYCWDEEVTLSTEVTDVGDRSYKSQSGRVFAQELGGRNETAKWYQPLISRLKFLPFEHIEGLDLINSLIIPMPVPTALGTESGSSLLWIVGA